MRDPVCICIIIVTMSVCNLCKCKVSLTAIKCKCGNIYCNAHRYAEEHACTYNYRAKGAAALEAAMPVITADKVIKI